MVDAAPDVFEPAKLGPVSLRNRVIKAATFEGSTPGGVVTDRLVDYHLRVARGGVGMTTVAYLAVSPDGRVNRHGLVLSAATVTGLRELTDAVHAEGAAACAQIGHAGMVADTRSNAMPTLAPSTRFAAPAKTVVRGASRDDIGRVTRDFARAAECAVEAGFDAIEVHLGHGYLLSSFLSPNLNRRKDDYGRTLEGRARFPREVVRAVRDAAGPGVAVTAKLNMADGTKRGLWPDESIEIARMLQADGALDAIELSGGSSLQNAMYYFRGDVPMREFAATQPKLIGLGLRVAGRRLFPSYPFEEAFFLPFARRFRAALDLPLILLGGINRLDTMRQAMAEGFEFVAMGRALLREPDLVNRMRAGESSEALCIHCNKCVPTIYSGTRCVLIEDAPQW
jgi:2,4-dienoyl-CoA reductase-like NADH-dependent reductase (Old Yellow Enzyme family)